MSLVSSVRHFGLGLALASLVGLSTLALPAVAQDSSSAASSEAAVTEVATIDPAAAERGFKVWRGSDCAGCHGWAGNGEKIGENPKGPNLRVIEFDAATLKEVILCGRPSTLMPSHDPKAYDDDRCYGLVEADLGKTKPPKGKPMTSEDADDIVAFIQQDIMGKPERPTLEECQRYYGKKPLCNMYAE
jgi:mono/diheme cytochrome c family protein